MQYITISVQDIAVRQRNLIAVEYERILIPMLNNLKWPTLESRRQHICINVVYTKRYIWWIYQLDLNSYSFFIKSNKKSHISAFGCPNEA